MHLESSVSEQNHHKYYHQEQQQKPDSQQQQQKAKHKDEKQGGNNSLSPMKDNITKSPQKQFLDISNIKEEGSIAENSQFLSCSSGKRSHKQSHSLSPLRLQQQLDDNCFQVNKVEGNKEQSDYLVISSKVKSSHPNRASSLIDQKLSEPLPLLEKGKFEVQEFKPKIIINEVKTQSQMQNKRKKKKKVMSNQQNTEQTEEQKKQQFLKKQSRYKYVPDHKCVKISDTIERCNICYGAMAQEYYTKNTDDAIKYPFDICYIDYIPTFIKKMDIQVREKLNAYKKFLQLYTLPDIKQFAYYILDRISKYAGMEDFLSENKRIPKCLDNYDQKVKCREFDKIMVMGDYENSNISSCSINKSNDQLMILLKSDSNTKGCIHWFQFTVVAKEPCTIQFVILNNKRNGQHYKDGMKIAVIEQNENNKLQSASSKYLLATETSNQYNWQRKSENVFYYKSNVDNIFYRQNTENLTKEQLEKKKIQKRGYQTLDFTYTFEKAGQRVVFAHSYAYTFTDLCNYLAEVERKLKLSCPSQDSQEKDPQATITNSSEEVLKIKTDDIYYKKKIIAHSRLGLPIHQIKITANKRTGPYRKRKRKIVYIVARQHPGESPSSFVCQGFISYILSDQESSKFLREIYIFKIVPMVNPDGVVLGNTRCNLSGFDLNRKWQFPDKKLTPEVYFLKEEIKKTQQKREVIMFCDLHGHSQLTNFFLYGCNKTTDGGTTTWTKVRLLPHILAKRTEFFTLSECRFKVTDDRISTARVTAWQELGIPYSFTVETSFYGYQKMVYDEKTNQSVKQFCHFTVEDLYKIGEVIGQAFVEQVLTLEQLQYELSLTKGSLNAKYKQITTNVSVNPKNFDNSAYEELMKSTKGSLYHTSNNNTSKNSNNENAQTFQQSNTIQSCFQSTSSNVLGRQYSGYEEDQLKRKTTATFRGQSLGKTSTSKRAVLSQNMSDKKKYSQNLSANKGNTIQSEDMNSIDTQQMKTSQKKSAKNQLNIFTNGNQMEMSGYQQQPKSSNNINVEDNLQSERYHPVLSQEQLLQICPHIERNWRDYFEKKDLENNFRLIEQGEDPNDLESLDGGSDSEPEDDLYEEDEWPFPIHEDEEEDDETANKKNQQNSDAKKPVQNLKKKVYPVHNYQNPVQQQQRYYYPISKVGQAFDSQPQTFLPMPSAKTSVEPVALMKKYQKKKQQESQQQKPLETTKYQNTPVLNNANNGGNYINQIQNRSYEQNQKQQSQYFTLPTQNDNIFSYEVVNSFQQQNNVLKDQQAILKQKQQMLHQQLAQAEQLSLTQRQNKVQRGSKNTVLREKTQEDDRSPAVVKVFNMEQIDGQGITKLGEKNYKTIIQRKIESKLKSNNEKIQNSYVQQQSRQKKMDDDQQGGAEYYSEDETLVLNSQSQNRNRDKLNLSRINQTSEKVRERNISNNSMKNNQKRADSSNTYNQASHLLEDLLYSKPSYHHSYHVNVHKNENTSEQALHREYETKGSPNLNIRNSYSRNRQQQAANIVSLNQSRAVDNNEVYLQTYIENDIVPKGESTVNGNNYNMMLNSDDTTDMLDKQKRKEYISAIQQKHKLLQSNNSNSASQNISTSQIPHQNMSHYESSPMRYGYAMEDTQYADQSKSSSKYLESYSNNNLKNKSYNQVSSKDFTKEVVASIFNNNDPNVSPMKERQDLQTSIAKKDYYQIKETNSLNLEKNFQSRKGSRNEFSMKRASRIGRSQYPNAQQLIQNMTANQSIFPNIQQPNSNPSNNQTEYDQSVSIIGHLDLKRQKPQTKTYSSDAKSVQQTVSMNNNSFNGIINTNNNNMMNATNMSSSNNNYGNNNNVNTLSSSKVYSNLKYSVYSANGNNQNNTSKFEKPILPTQSISIGIQNNNGLNHNYAYSASSNNTTNNQILLNLNALNQNRKILLDQKVDQSFSSHVPSNSQQQQQLQTQQSAQKATSQISIKTQINTPNLNSPSPLLALNNKANNKIILNYQK